MPGIDETVVTYCSNPACGNIKAVARRLEKLGYGDVRTYPDVEWSRISPASRFSRGR
jgi:hypothetical protein